MEINNFIEFILAYFPKCPDVIEEKEVFSTPDNYFFDIYSNMF